MSPAAAPSAYCSRLAPTWLESLHGYLHHVGWLCPARSRCRRPGLPSTSSCAASSAGPHRKRRAGSIYAPCIRVPFPGAWITGAGTVSCAWAAGIGATWLPSGRHSISTDAHWMVLGSELPGTKLQHAATDSTTESVLVYGLWRFISHDFLFRNTFLSPIFVSQNSILDYCW